MRVGMFIAIVVSAIAVSAQNEDAYKTKTGDELQGTSLLDPSRFDVRHSVSFGAMSSSGVNGLKSQSMYATMMQYRFAAPVTLNLNFALPIHSTFSSAQNLTPNNLQSLDYFKSMPFEMSLNWQPTKNTFFQLSIVKPSQDYMYNYYNGYQNPWNAFSRIGYASPERTHR
ncbi:MAG: hypothetical protein JW913_14205 [Chitinispirillaceae bacterium]|nr:hypothetical protein [Chitinispirillaceae bacterium]